MALSNAGSSLLNLDFNIKKGLILNWNFKGQLSNSNFYRHLIILDTDDAAKVQTFLKLYYKKVRIGDLFAIKKTLKSKSSKSLKWKQKNLIDSPSFDNIYSDQFEYQELAETLFQMADETEHGQGQWPLIISVLSEKTDISKIVDLISEIRKLKSSFNFIINLFGPFKNNINFRNGVNCFEFLPINKECVLQFYKNYISRIQFYFVQIHIECENGSISCQKSSEWPNTALNRITKQFYGPHMDYQSDTLFFLNAENYGELDLILHISMEYETLEGRKFKSNKRVSLKSIDNQIQSRTLGITDNLHQLEMHKNVWFEKYPFKTQYFVWFNKDKDNNLKDSLRRQQDSV